MFKLIRDNIPEIVKKEGKVINYATAENDELYFALLKNKLAEEVSEFLASNDINELVDVYTVIDALIKTAGVNKDDFTKLCQEKLKIRGGFDKKLIGFFPDQPIEKSEQSK